MSEEEKTRVRRSDGRFVRFCKRHAFRPGKVILAGILALACVAALGFFSLRNTAFFSKTTALGLKNIGELATQAGYFTTVQTISKSRNVLGLTVPGTQSNYVYSYDGTIKAGINFEDIDVRVDPVSQVITVRLPEFRILSTEIDDDSFTLYNDGANLFTSLKMEDVSQSLTELKKNARETAVKNGILENARANAELLIRGLLAGMYDLNTYTVRFESAAESAAAGQK